MPDLPDCGHLCCDERHDPLHDHFLAPHICPSCEARRAATVGTESWDDVPIRDCYTKVQGQRCGPEHGWASWLNTLYVCPGTEATDAT